MDKSTEEGIHMKFRFNWLKEFIKRMMPKAVRSRLLVIGQKFRKNIVSREEIIRKDISKEQKGLEIGPSHHPIVSKKEGFQVEVVDWLDQQGLREHYKGHGVDLEAIEEVDYIWKGGSYYQLIGKKDYYDYIIASHMIEHTTDFVGFLQDCSKMLKPDGILRLAIPDKRYCFDHFRDVTGLAEVLNNFYQPNMLQSVGNVAEYHMNVVAYKKKISWDRQFGRFGTSALSDKHYTFVHTLEQVKETMRLVSEENEYRDIHHYVFTPSSFELLIEDLRMLELLDMEIIEKRDTKGNEFLVMMKKTNYKNTVVSQDRKQLLRKRNRENKI